MKNKVRLDVLVLGILASGTVCIFQIVLKISSLQKYNFFSLFFSVTPRRRLQEEELQVRPASLPAIPNPFPELCSPSGSPLLSPGSLPQPSESHVRVENRHCGSLPRGYYLSDTHEMLHEWFIAGTCMRLEPYFLVQKKTNWWGFSEVKRNSYELRLIRSQQVLLYFLEN